MTDLEKAARMALEKVQEFKSRWWKVPPFGNKLNKAQREAITFAQVPIFELEDALRQALSDSVEQPLCDHSSTRIRKIRNYPPGSHISPHVSVNPKSIKPWVGLDHDDIHALVNEFFYRGMQPSGTHFANFGRAIEAKLKEKNS